MGYITEPIPQKQALLKLLKTWREEGDEEEPKSTWEYLRKQQ